MFQSLQTYDHLFVKIFLSTCFYYAKLCTHFKRHSHKRARTLQRGLLFRQFKLFCLQTSSSIDFGQIVELSYCMIRPSLIVIYVGFRHACILSCILTYIKDICAEVPLAHSLYLAPVAKIFIQPWHALCVPYVHIK